MALASAQVAYPGFAGGPYATAYLSGAYAPTFGYSSYGASASASAAAALSTGPVRTALDVFNPYVYNFHPYANLYAARFFPHAVAPVPAVTPAAPAPAAVAVEPAATPLVKVRELLFFIR